MEKTSTTSRLGTGRGTRVRLGRENTRLDWEKYQDYEQERASPPPPYCRPRSSFKAKRGNQVGADQAPDHGRPLHSPGTRQP